MPVSFSLFSAPGVYIISSSAHTLHVLPSLCFLHLILKLRWVKYNNHIMHDETREGWALIKSTQKEPITNAMSDYIRFDACFRWKCFKGSNWQYRVSASILPWVCPCNMSLTLTWTAIQKKLKSWKNAYTFGLGSPNAHLTCHRPP